MSDREALNPMFAGLAKCAAVVGGKPIAQLSLLGLMLIGSVWFVNTAYVNYRSVSRELQELRYLQQWLRRVLPAVPVESAPRNSLVRDATILASVTELALQRGAVIDRADYQGDRLAISFNEHPFEHMVDLLVTLEGKKGVAVIDATITQGVEPGSCSARVILADEL